MRLPCVLRADRRKWVDVSEQRYERDPEQRDSRLHSSPRRSRVRRLSVALPQRRSRRGRHHSRRSGSPSPRRPGRLSRSTTRVPTTSRARRTQTAPASTTARPVRRRSQSSGAGTTPQPRVQTPAMPVRCSTPTATGSPVLALRDGGHRRLLHDAALLLRGRQPHRSLRRLGPRWWARSPRQRPWPSCRFGPPSGVPGSADYDAAHVTGNTCRTSLLHAGHRRDGRHSARGLRQPGGRVPGAPTSAATPQGSRTRTPSDCVFAPNNGFLTIVKVANPDDGTSFPFNASEQSESNDSSWTITGSGSQSLISYGPTATLDLNEAVPAGWSSTPPPARSRQPPTATNVHRDRHRQPRDPLGAGDHLHLQRLASEGDGSR